MDRVFFPVCVVFMDLCPLVCCCLWSICGNSSNPPAATGRSVTLALNPQIPPAGFGPREHGESSFVHKSATPALNEIPRGTVSRCQCLRLEDAIGILRD